MNVTVCLTQTTTASFTCVVEDRGSIGVAIAGWYIRVGEETYLLIPPTGRDRHMTNVSTRMNGNTNIVTDTLTVTNVSVNDNGAQYRCQPFGNVISDVVTLTVLGMCVHDYYRLYI